jgi:hypothetical protein
LQRRLSARETLAQIGWIVIGLALVLAARQWLHPH